jgi:hypothetical protein
MWNPCSPERAARRGGEGRADNTAAPSPAGPRGLLAYWQTDRAAWRTALLRGGVDPWVEPEPGGPATRPWAWWTFDREACEPRRALGCWRYTEPVAVEPPPALVADMAHWQRRWRESRPQHFRFGIPIQCPGGVLVRFERECEYLERLNLLGGEERAALAATSP